MPDWDAKSVEYWLVRAHQADPRISNRGERAPLAWLDHCVPPGSPREMLELWVWCRTRGLAFSEVVESRGRPHSTALRHKNIAVDRIVRCLNAA